MGIGSVALIDMNRSHLPLAVSLIIILSSAPIAYAMFLTPVEIIDAIGDGSGNTLSSVEGIATDSSGNVFVTGAISNNVFQITPGGTITQIIDSTGDGTNTLDDPRNIATDSSGNVFVVGKNTNNAFKIATPGTCSTGGTACTITKIMDATGDGGGNALSEPFDVATDSSGNVFVTGRDSNNAFKIAKDIPIGGTLIPIDTTTLLLAGVQSISMWMIPVVVAGIGIGIFVIKRRK